MTISRNVVNECYSSLSRSVVYTKGTSHTSRLFGFSVCRGLYTVTLKSAKDGATE